MAIIIPSVIGVACFPLVFKWTFNKGWVASIFALGTGITMIVLYFFSPNTSPIPFYLFAALSRVINSKETDVLKEVDRLTEGRGADLAIETAGMEITARQAIHITKKGATIVLVGYSKSGEMTLPLSLALDKELTFKTVFRYRHIYPMAIEAVASGKVNLKGIVTNVFDFDDIQNAMDSSVRDKANIVKSVIKIG